MHKFFFFFQNGAFLLRINIDSFVLQIVFNTFSKGEWGKEERKSNPYKKGDDIDIRIRAHDSKYTIYVDQVIV